jgi:4-diphosphocytidyl-2-C-methyl-D-erythritol kinase
VKKLILKAPAKVNLYLDVLRKRPDAYHDIETVFEKIALFDTITVKKSAGKKITINADHPLVPTDKGNLVYRAAEAIFKEAAFKGGVRVDIKKGIPVQAGLGGGSSDAASALIGINQLFRFGFGREQLARLARPIGADVALFTGDCVFAAGSERGDNIRPIAAHTNIRISHIIITFNFGISAACAYKGISRNLKLTPPGRNVRILSRFIRGNDIENLASSLYNELEDFILAKYRVVAAAKKMLLEEGAAGALVSGSGPTVFGITRTREEAYAVKRRVERRIGPRADRILIVSTL